MAEVTNDQADGEGGTPEESAILNEKAQEELDRLIELLQSTALKLGEHFDSVRIITTVNRGNGVYAMASRGAGNFFAQRDSVREWLIMRDQETKNEAGAE
jgi:hypothetical protein